MGKSLTAGAVLATLLSLTACAVQPTMAQPAWRDGQALASQNAPGRAAWLEGAVVYGVVPPLFGEAPFRAVAAKLDYLKDQGVDAIWLSPINATDDPSGISYGVTDYFQVRQDFGSMADFKRLVDEAHRRGLRVLMDFVPNHTSTGHPHYQDAEKRGKASPYWDHYVRDKAGNAQHYFNWETLKNLNYDHPGVQRMMTEAFTFWVKEMGVDGFRVDAAWGVKDRNPDYWPKLSAELSRIKPDVFLLAEASARDPYYVRNGFDAAYDWTKDLGKWSWEKVWQDPERVGERLSRALAGRETPPHQVARFLNNNDTGPRFISTYGPDMQRVAAVLLHTLPGIPVVYTGDEVGAEFEPYEDPPPIAWQDRFGFRPLYKHLAELREKLPALRRGAWTEARVSSPGSYAFLRDAGGREQALVVLNFGKGNRLSVDVPSAMQPHLAAGRLRDVLSGKAVAFQVKGRALVLDMPPSSALILTP